MKIQFLGAATTVTGSQHLLTTDRARVLVDCGMFQGGPSESHHNRDGFAFDPARIDVLLLTHAHLDHCGMIPLLVKEGFRGRVVTTRATVDLARLVLLDSGKLQVEQARAHAERSARLERRSERLLEAHPTPDSRRPSGAARGGGDPERPPVDPEGFLRSQPADLETTHPEPLYDEDDAAAALTRFQGVDYEETVEVAPGIQATFHDAGHILGSAIIVVDASEGGLTRRVVFSGDLGRPDTPILRDPTAIVGGADYVLCESTYGGREHEPEGEAVDLLAQAVRATADHSGVLLVPSFAIGRTQEIIWYLDRLLDAGRIPHLPLYVDSPMASRATDVYRAFPGYYDEETGRLLAAGESPLDYPGAQFTTTPEQSRAIAHRPRPMMIVSASGMLTGGRIVHHLANLIDDPAAMLLFVGYQGEGTLGAHLQAGVGEVRINGQPRAVRCQIRSISGFSAHADEDELAAWLQRFADAPRRPQTVFLVHGDPEPQAAMARRVAALGLTAYRPRWRETVELA